MYAANKYFPKISYYEAIVLYKAVPKDELIPMIKRSAEAVFSRGGFFRNIYNLGLLNTPYRISKNQLPYWKANYIMYEIHLPKACIPDLYNEFIRDTDIINHGFVHQENNEINYDNCTFEEEMRPVPYRPQVERLVELSQKTKIRKDKRKMKLNLSTDFFPFQR